MKVFRVTNEAGEFIGWEIHTEQGAEKTYQVRGDEEVLRLGGFVPGLITNEEVRREELNYEQVL